MATEHDWQAIRDWVAERVMGWELGSHLHRGPLTEEEMEHPYLWEWNIEVTDDHVVRMGYSHWQPERDLAQAYQVMQAMRAAGWQIKLFSRPEYFFGQWVNVKTGAYSPMTRADTFPEWVTLSAALATGYEEE